MKKLFVMLALCCGVMTANAQNEVGTITLQPKVGLNMASLTDCDDSKTRMGIVAGVEAAYNMSESIALSAGVNYSMQGVKIDGGGDPTYKMDYINIPVLANYYVIPGLAIKAGVQPGFLVSAKCDDDDIKDNCKSFDLSIPVGVSYEYQNFVLDARYNFGMTKVFEDGDSKNSVISITLGYKFGI